jgi:uncharacterized membrane protein YfcA
MDISFIIILKNVLVGLVIGFAIGMTGIGGGALIQPSLIYIIGLTPVSAVGTGLVYAVITKLNGVFWHLKQKTVNKTYTLYFLCGSLPGVLIASLTINYLFNNYNKTTLNFYLRTLIGCVLLITSLILIFQILSSKQNIQTGKNNDTRKNNLTIRKDVLGILSGFFIGILIGSTSIGSGVMIIPALILIFNASAHEAVGTSIAISVVLSVLGGIVYFSYGYVELSTTIFLTLGSIPGVFLGSKLSVKISGKLLKTIVIIIVTISGISMFIGKSNH